MKREQRDTEKNQLSLTEIKHSHWEKKRSCVAEPDSRLDTAQLQRLRKLEERSE